MKRKRNSNEHDELLPSSKHMNNENNNNNNNAEDFHDEMIIEEKESEQLPPLHDAFNIVLFNYLSNAELLNLSEACKDLRDWSANERNKRAASPLLLAIVQGNEEEAKRLLKMNPHLLRNTKGEATDYSNRAIKNLTPFQAALCAGDVEMCEMMKEYFLQLKDGEAELQSQFDAVFPNGLETHAQTQQENIFDFNEILQAIINAPNNEVTAALNKAFDENQPLHQALEKFRQAFTKKSLSETVFNPHHLLRAFQTYDDNFNHLGNWDKRDLFWRQVIGFAQRYLPACYLQVFAQGLYYIVDESEAFRRSFDFRVGGTIIPFVLGSGAGFNYAVGVVGLGTDSDDIPLPPGAPSSVCGWCFVKIMSSKNKSLGKITQPNAARADQVVCNSLK